MFVQKDIIMFVYVCGIPLDEPQRVPNAKSVRKCVGNTNLENVKSEENKRMYIKTRSGPFVT